MKIFLTFLAACLLIGCSTRPDWAQEGKTRQEAKYEAVDCYDTLLAQHANFQNLTDQEIAQLMRECMKAKGYHDKRLTQ